MPIFYVDEEILNKRLECIVCPIKITQLFLFKEMYGKIASICGKEEMYQEYIKARIKGPSKAGLCSGLKIDEFMIQILVTPFPADEFFEQNLYNAYLDIIKTIIEKRFTSVVIPYLPYGNKRLGNMYSYKTGKVLLSYLMEKYKVDCNIYILVEKQVMEDHLDGYTSTYVSTSYPITKRHKPMKYPLCNNPKLEIFLGLNNVPSYDRLTNETNFKMFPKGKFKMIYEMIRKKYDDSTFCYLANLDKSRYIQIFTGKINPSKYEVFAISIILKLPMPLVIKFLEVVGEKFEDDILDNMVIGYFNNKVTDILSINERLFMLELPQLGSYKPAYEY